MLYTAKCFWPGVTEDELRLAAARAQNEPARGARLFRGALYLPGDELVLCLFDASSRAAVKRASERAGMPCERVIDTVWVAPRTLRRGGLIVTQEPPSSRKKGCWASRPTSRRPRSLRCVPAFGTSPGQNGQIVFAQFPPLWVVNPDGTGERKFEHLKRSEDIQPDWSPDGAKIALRAAGARCELWTIKHDGRIQARRAGLSAQDQLRRPEQPVLVAGLDADRLRPGVRHSERAA